MSLLDKNVFLNLHMPINIKNRKASFEYELINKFIAGISLKGTEIKSIRNNKANISDAYCIYR